MKLSIPAWRGDHYVSLAELLVLLERFLQDKWWIVRVQEIAPEPEAQALEKLDPEEQIDTQTLLRLVKPNLQIIDGEVIAIDNGDAYLLLRAVDSTTWDIETANRDIAELTKTAYPEASEISD